MDNKEHLYHMLTHEMMLPVAMLVSTVASGSALVFLVWFANTFDISAANSFIGFVLSIALGPSIVGLVLWRLHTKYKQLLLN